MTPDLSKLRELLEVAEADRDTASETVSALLSEIERLTAERDALKAQKWDVKHADTANDMALMGMARDAAEARVKVLEECIREACDFLAERTYGSPARSPAHNARVRLETALRSGEKEA